MPLLTLAQLLSSGSSLIAVLVTSTTLGIADRGVASFVLATASLLSVFATFGLYIPVSTDSNLRNGPVKTEYFAALLTMTAVVSIVALIISSFSFGLFTPTVAACVVTALVLTATFTFSQRVLQARVSAQRYLLLSALGAASLLLATAATFTWPSWSAFAWTYVLGLTFATGVGLWLLIEDVGIEGFVPNASGVVRALKLTLPIAVGLAGQILLWRGDTVALGLTTTDSSEVAVYAIAVAGTGIVWLPVEAVSLMLYRQFALGGPNDQLQRSVIRLSLQAMAIACVVGVVVGAALLAVTSTALPSYRNAVALYMLLLLGVIPASAGRVLFSAATAVRNTRLLWQFSAVALASFALYIPATLIAHGWGAAAASVVMYLITTAILVRVLPLSAPKRMPETTL